jgi:hypothetical protein
MTDPAFEIYAASWVTVCEACNTERFDDLRSGTITRQFMFFPAEFSESQIIQLGEAVTSLTGVESDFGRAENRREPSGCVFVDLLHPEWVKGAALLRAGSAVEIADRWIAACTVVYREPPVWAEHDPVDLVQRFLELCRVAVRDHTDLVMVWIL